MHELYGDPHEKKKLRSALFPNHRLGQQAPFSEKRRGEKCALRRSQWSVLAQTTRAAATGSVTGSARRCLSCSRPADISRSARAHTHTPTAGSVLHARETAHTPQKSNAKRKLGRPAQGRAPNAARRRTVAKTAAPAGARKKNARMQCSSEKETHPGFHSWPRLGQRSHGRRTDDGRTSALRVQVRGVAQQVRRSVSERSTRATAAAAAALLPHPQLRSSALLPPLCRRRRYTRRKPNRVCTEYSLRPHQPARRGGQYLPAWPDPAALAPTLAERKNQVTG